MKDKILRLARRLNKFTLEEISSIAEADEEKVKLILDELEENKILKRNNKNYLFISTKNIGNRVNLNLKYQHHSKETLDFIKKAFCADVETLKIAQILGLSRKCITEFYNDFKTLIYNNQKSELLKHYSKSPKVKSIRVFFNIECYLYFYKNKLYISKEKLESQNPSKYKKSEMAKLKMLYARAKRRLINSCSYQKNYSYHIAEKIWRDKKSYIQLEQELSLLLKLKIY